MEGGRVNDHRTCRLFQVEPLGEPASARLVCKPVRCTTGRHHERNVLIQAVNHASNDRSQVATLLSQQDITPPELDGWAYYGVMNER